VGGGEVDHRARRRCETPERAAQPVAPLNDRLALASRASSVPHARADRQPDSPVPRHTRSSGAGTLRAWVPVTSAFTQAEKPQRGLRPPLRLLRCAIWGTLGGISRPAFSPASVRFVPTRRRSGGLGAGRGVTYATRPVPSGAGRGGCARSTEGGRGLRGARAPAPAHQQARVGPEADECFARAAVAELTMPMATSRWPEPARLPWRRAIALDRASGPCSPAAARTVHVTPIASGPGCAAAGSPSSAQGDRQSKTAGLLDCVTTDRCRDT